MKFTKTLVAVLMLTMGLASATEVKKTACTNEATFAKSVIMSHNAEGIPKRVAAGIVASVYDAHDLTPDQNGDLAFNTSMSEEG